MTLPRVIIDTREQTPLEPFIVEKGRRIYLPTMRRKLEVGDYAAEGLEWACAIERKSLADLAGTLFGRGVDAMGEAASNQDRFRAELLRGRPIPLLYVLVEGSWRCFEQHLQTRHRRVGVASAFGLLASFEVLYRARVVWAGDSERASWFAGFVLNYIHEQHTDPKAAGKARERGCGDLPWLAKEDGNGQG